MMSSAVPDLGSSPTRRGAIRRPRERPRVPLDDHVEVDGHRQVVHDGIGVRERHVVDHRHVGNRDVEDLRDPSVGADDDVLDVIDEVGPVVGHGVEFAGCRVVLRMGAEAVRQGAEEPVGAERVELVAEFDGWRTGLDHRPRGAREPADVRVGGGPVVARDVVGCGTTRPDLRGAVRRAPCPRP